MVQFTAPLVGSSCADCPATVSSGRPWKAVGAADGAASLRFDHSAKPGNIVEVVIGRNVPNHCTPRAPLAGEQVLCGRCQQARSKKVPDVADLSLLFDAFDGPAAPMTGAGPSHGASHVVATPVTEPRDPPRPKRPMPPAVLPPFKPLAGPDGVS